MATNTSRCERILALIDDCLAEVAATAAASASTADRDVPTVTVPLGNAHDGGITSS